MFNSNNRTGFGTNTTTPSFGFGSNTQNPFSQNQVFGTPVSSTFGNPSTAFGQAATPMFGAQQQSAPLFGTPSSSSAPAFGTTTQNVFGSTSIFGQQNQTQPTNLFGSTSGTFGQQNKTTGFNFPASQSTSIFGQTSAQPLQQNIFQGPTSSNIFSNTGFGTTQTPDGTLYKFVPVTGTDTMQKGGTSSMINTKLFSITCMKEYEAKSFEELRLEDYTANRKGPQQSTGFGTPAPAFGAVVSTAPTIFGQPENKTVFGAQSGTFGQSAFGMGAQAGAGNVFGKPSTPFGVPVTSTSSFGFGSSPSTNIFGATQPVKPFGTQPTQPLFNQPTTGFGSNPLFGQAATTQQNTAFFNKQAQTSFSAPSTGQFNFGQTTTPQPSTIFQTAKPSFSLFGQNTNATNTFGQQPSSFGGFNAFAKPAQSTFGQQPQNTGFGSGTSLQTSNLFGGIGTKPAFGTNTNSGLFSGTSIGQANSAFSLQPAVQSIPTASQTQANELRNLFDMTGPYGFSPHLDGLFSVKRPEQHYPPNPKDVETVIRIQDSQIQAEKQKKLKICPLITAKNKWYLFESSFEKSDFESLDMNIKRSGKRLNLKRVSLNRPEPLIIYEKGKIVGEHKKTLEYSLPNAFKTSTSTQYDSKEEIKTTLDAVTCMDPSGEEGETKEVNTKETDELQIINMDKEKMLASKEIDTCGIICTRPEYYTIPALEEISNFKNEDGTCVIKGFTIGRIGYGNVYFPDEMDVSNLNIDDLVHFRYREICIYTDDKTKPPIGEGLNRKAQVTLDRVFPKKENNRKEIETDPKVLINNHFADNLKDICLKLNTTFVDYRPETGSWVFNVPHFSRYSFFDSYKNKKYSNQKVLKKKDKIEDVRIQEILKNYSNCNGPLKRAKLNMCDNKRICDHITLDKDSLEDIDFKNIQTSPFYKSLCISSYGYKSLYYYNVYNTVDKVKGVVTKFIKANRCIINYFIIKAKPKIHLHTLLKPSLYTSMKKSSIPSKHYVDVIIFKGGIFWSELEREFTIATPHKFEFNLNLILLVDVLRFETRFTLDSPKNNLFMHSLVDFAEILNKCLVFNKENDEDETKRVPDCDEVQEMKILHKIAELSNLARIMKI